MKKLTFLLVLTFICTTLFSQEFSKRKEVGLTFSNLDHFGLTYRVGTDKALWRYNLAVMNLGFRNEDKNGVKENRFNFSLSLGIGREFRKSISPELDFRYGGDLSLSYAYSKEKNTNPSLERSQTFNGFSTSAGLVLGFNYKLSDQLIFGAELLPRLDYNWRNDKGDLSTNIKSDELRFVLSNSALLSLIYSF